ncbi:uncharacterized protein LOC111394250 [Olea europaea var. sylvestris]|uniref:uncharacterized protein LOC111394250 n=1 Tax=Olea europaea var. sylvestris TaxID=158386 RepID=UPI000C1D1894|nr:uncharacterized protein LOC111394250 [Olea europaea var. sylvestris]
MVEEFKKKMMRDFEMSDLGQMKYFLGIQVKQSPGRIFLSQEKYIDDLLEKSSMNQCKPVSTPMGPNEKFQVNDDAEKVDATLYRKLIGSLIYLNTRPDITQSVSLLSRFMNEPSKNHFTAAKRILRYLKGTKNQGIEFKKENNFNLVGYTDSDWAGSLVDRKSTSGYIFCLGTNIISWSSRKQRSIALSSAEAEYIAAADAACEAVWLRRILKDLMIEQQEPTTIHCDNMSAIAMTKNPVFHARSKHIELRHHFIRDLIDLGSGFGLGFRFIVVKVDFLCRFCGGRWLFSSSLLEKIPNKIIENPDLAGCAVIAWNSRPSAPLERKKKRDLDEFGGGGFTCKLNNLKPLLAIRVRVIIL